MWSSLHSEKNLHHTGPKKYRMLGSLSLVTCLIKILQLTQTFVKHGMKFKACWKISIFLALEVDWLLSSLPITLLLLWTWGFGVFCLKKELDVSSGCIYLHLPFFWRTFDGVRPVHFILWSHFHRAHIIQNTQVEISLGRWGCRGLIRRACSKGNWEDLPLDLWKEHVWQ